ncbi:MAG TPA: hypothetical protein VEJ63_23865 [Planctomycetota bacterium]|nr:hypothetical protein [Planctomycetota bacterium]
MPNASFEQSNGVLIVTGSLDRAGDAELQKELDRYCKDPAVPEKIVDMSNVRWLTPTGAKVLIQVGQDMMEKGNKLRVVASRHVNQTLNLLGAKTWLQIENAITPVKNSEPDPAAAAPANLTDSQKKIVLNGGAAAPAPEAPAPAPAAAAPAPAVAAPAAQPIQQTATASGLLQAIARTGALASPNEELSGGAHLLRILFPNRRYSFHFSGGNDIIGVVRDRVGGSWILVETQSTRKIVNLDVVEYCEIL